MSLAVLENPAFTLDINKLIHKKVIACESPTAATASKMELGGPRCSPAAVQPAAPLWWTAGPFFYLVNRNGKRKMDLDKGCRRRCRRKADRDRGMFTHI